MVLATLRLHVLCISSSISVDKLGLYTAEAAPVSYGAVDHRWLGWPMPRHTLFAYVEGSDLDDIADALEGRLRAFVEWRDWVASEAWVVNQQLEADASCMEPEDIPLKSVAE